jgi:hypothetical protein
MLNTTLVERIAAPKGQTKIVEHRIMRTAPQWRHVAWYTVAVFVGGFALGTWNPPQPATAETVTPAVATSKAPAP